jgi:excisionase family DNA binding protein
MTLKDVADYLRMNERTIAKLAQDGTIPGFKIASQWRFLKESIDGWFAQQIHRSGQSEASSGKPKIAALAAAETMILELKSRTKEGVLAEMTDMLVAGGRVSSGALLLAALKERERLCSTGIGRGIAFIHPRRVITEGLREPVLAFGRSSEGIDFDAVDGQKVNLFFLDLAPTERQHLAVLAKLSRLLAEEKLVEGLRRAVTTTEVMEMIRQSESRLAES